MTRNSLKGRGSLVKSIFFLGDKSWDLIWAPFMPLHKAREQELVMKTDLFFCRSELAPPSASYLFLSLSEAFLSSHDLAPSFPPLPLAKLWIEKTNDLIDIETEISQNLKGLVAIEIATTVSLAEFETAIWFFET